MMPLGLFRSPVSRLGPAVRSAIRSLCDGKRTLRKPYATSSIYEYARWQMSRTAVCKFQAPHFEFPASGEEPHHGVLPVGRVAPGFRRAGLDDDAVPLGQLADRIVAFLREHRENHQALISWCERNRHALREFWARTPADASASNRSSKSCWRRTASRRLNAPARKAW